MPYRSLVGYTHPVGDLEVEDLGVRHPHTVRRESQVVYKDEFALDALLEDNPVYYEQELEGWARSYYTLEGHMNAIYAYAVPDVPITALDQRLYRESIQAVQNELYSLPVVRAFDVLTELDQVQYEWSSSAGYDYIGHKGPIGEDNHRRAMSRAKAILFSVIEEEGEGPFHLIQTSVPDVGYTRTQLTNLAEKTKVRGVWGRAFHTILLEGTAARPLLDAFARSKTFFHIGQDPQLSVPELLTEVKRQCKWLTAIDWSNFDATVSRFEINAAFDILKTRIQFPNFETEQAYEICRQLFIHKKVAAPNGETFMVHKGIPSGSYYTSVIGSIVNRLRIEYIWRCIRGEGPKVCYTQGDDSLIGDDFLVQPWRIAEIANPLGWIINEDKTVYSTAVEEVTFLGRTSRGGLNARSVDKCLRLLIYPEYPVESGRISAYRADAIARDCGGLNEPLNRIARKLRRLYGIASDEEVPKHFRRYVMQ